MGKKKYLLCVLLSPALLLPTVARLDMHVRECEEQQDGSEGCAILREAPEGILPNKIAPCLKNMGFSKLQAELVGGRNEGEWYI